jgi:hypothetical protein
MSDNRRIYRIIRKAIQQLYPTSPNGNLARHLNTLAALVSGIVQGKSCQLPNIAQHAPETAKPESRIKRYSRWIKNKRVDFEVFYLPFIQQILNGLVNIRPLAFVMDDNEVGHECITLLVSVLYGKRALPVTWLVVKGRKGHLAEELHLELLQKLHAIVPIGSQVYFLGDGEFDGIEVQATIDDWEWLYVCRTSKNIQLYEEDIPFSFIDLCLRPGDCIGIPNVQFTRQAYGPVTAIAYWQKGIRNPFSWSPTSNWFEKPVTGTKSASALKPSFQMKKAAASTFTKVISMILSALPNSCWRLAWLIYGLCIWASLHFVKIGSSLFTARIAVTGAYFASDCHSLIIF